MSKETVVIARAASAHPCRLWDARLAEPGKPLVVTIEEAADLIDRDPAEWILPASDDHAIINQELKRRSGAPEPAVDAGKGE